MFNFNMGGGGFLFFFSGASVCVSVWDYKSILSANFFSGGSSFEAHHYV